MGVQEKVVEPISIQLLKVESQKNDEAEKRKSVTKEQPKHMAHLKPSPSWVSAQLPEVAQSPYTRQLNRSTSFRTRVRHRSSKLPLDRNLQIVGRARAQSETPPYALSYSEPLNNRSSNYTHKSPMRSSLSQNTENNRKETPNITNTTSNNQTTIDATTVQNIPLLASKCEGALNTSTQDIAHTTITYRGTTTSEWNSDISSPQSSNLTPEEADTNTITLARLPSSKEEKTLKVEVTPPLATRKPRLNETEITGSRTPKRSLTSQGIRK